MSAQRESGASTAALTCELSFEQSTKYWKKNSCRFWGLLARILPQFASKALLPLPTDVGHTSQ